jgi:hypothetical protein
MAYNSWKEIGEALEILGFKNEGEYYKQSWNAQQYGLDQENGSWSVILQWQDADGADFVSGPEDAYYTQELVSA